MEVENGIKGRVVNDAHMTTATHQPMDLVMDRLDAVVITAVTRNPGFVAEIGVVGVRREKIVQAIAER
jgi:hypothetical protein